MTKHTDRELLELAAKAEGIEGSWSDYNQGICYSPRGSLDMHIWRPHRDDAQALRLAARWMMDIEIGTTHVTATIPLAIPIVSATEEFIDGDQRLPMTRRAIVRAAAAMAEGGEHG